MKTNSMKAGTIVTVQDKETEKNIQCVLMDNRYGNSRKCLVLTHPSVLTKVDMHAITRYKVPGGEYQYDVEFTDEQVMNRESDTRSLPFSE